MKLWRRRSAGDDLAGTVVESAKTGRAAAGRSLVTPGNAKKAVAIGKVLAPALAPIAMQLAAAARGAWDERRARRLGVPATELGSYSGKGGALHARISRIAASANDLASNAEVTADPARAAAVEKFLRANGARLADLAAAVRAAEMMPTDRRRAAHKAVAAELDHIEPELLGLLGVRSTNGVGPAAQ